MRFRLRTPVALFAFNRPDVTERVFQAIAHARPEKLFLICDGPRDDRHDDTENVSAVRAILKNVDWPCDVEWSYSEANLGCQQRVASGLARVFSEVEEAIILEDDCLPEPTFFSFCQAMLEHYRHDSRVAAVSGNNFQFGISRTEHSYYFSKYFHCWGWASWRRVWQHFDVGIRTWPEFRDRGDLKHWADSAAEEWYWTRTFNRQFAGKINSWAYPWLFNCWSQQGLTILPDKNLVSNIGFGETATHTCGKNTTANLPTFPIVDLTHPPEVVWNREADMYSFPICFYRDSIRRRLRRTIRRILPGRHAA